MVKRVLLHPLLLLYLSAIISDPPEGSGNTSCMQTPIKNIYITAAGDDTFDTQRGNTDVIVCMDNGTKYIASFFAYANIEDMRIQHQFEKSYLNGRYFWDKNMILIEECSPQTIESVIHDMIDEGNFQEAFRQL